jgi:hypothetical protein
VWADRGPTPSSGSIATPSGRSTATVDIGTSAPLEVAQADVRLLELELALKKAEYDLALIRKQIGK